MVRQLLTVTRLESGALHPRSEAVALAPRVKRAPWRPSPRPTSRSPSRTCRRAGWPSRTPDQLDQVLWALLDNAVKYGNRSPISVEVGLDEATKRLRLTITDSGLGVAEADRARLFGRFAGAVEPDGDEGSGGSGSGCTSPGAVPAMDGDLVLEPSVTGRGASLSVYLPSCPTILRRHGDAISRCRTGGNAERRAPQGARRTLCVVAARGRDTPGSGSGRGPAPASAASLGPDDPARVAGDQHRGNDTEDRPEGRGDAHEARGSSLRHTSRRTRRTAAATRFFMPSAPPRRGPGGP